MRGLNDFLETYLAYFKGREDYFACQGRDYYYPVKRSLNENYLQKHLNHFETFGVYVLTSDSKCNFICIDVDIPKNELENIDFKNPSRKFRYLRNKLLRILEVFGKEFHIPDNSILLEDTGGRGYHIWLFFSNPLQGDKAVQFYQICKSFIDFDFEFFPKQPNINEKRRFGNLIKLPLGTHQKYDSKSLFFQLLNGEIEFINSLDDNLYYLTKIKKMDPEIIDRIIDNYSGKFNNNEIEKIDSGEFALKERILYRKVLPFLFDNCKMLNELTIKAEKGIPFSKKEAFHFTNLLLSVEDGEDFIIEKIKESYGSRFSRDITQREIENIKPLFPTSCGRLISQGLCGGFCNKEIERINLDPLLTKTNPVSFWLQRSIKKPFVQQKEILDRIPEPENIINAYWKLKKYHRDEDVGFYDDFDFEYFEDNLEVNAQCIGRALKTKENIPFIGYLKVQLPKKIDENYEMQFRQMVYSPIFDQVVIQAIFNIVAPFIEQDFQDYSYGYRFDVQNLKSDNIFYDWREYYPKFRNRVLDHLRQPNIKYYICCDIKGFYDNIRHDILLEQLRNYVGVSYVSSIIEKVVQMYEFEEGAGIPQGPAYARILANLYLNDFDKNIKRYSSGFFRYVDDFFIFYESKEDAQEGLKKVHELLGKMGLTLSLDEKKKPEILESSNEEKITSKLDSMQYGIFEEYKFIDHLDIKQIDNFYNAIERHKVSPTNVDEVLDINNKLPSIIYLLSSDSLSDHSIKEKIPAIINFLVDQNLFYPKRLKYIFYKIIDLMIESSQDVTELFVKLNNTHKIYFLLSLYKKYKDNHKLKDILSSIIKHSLNEEDYFIRGFAIQISSELSEESISVMMDNDYLTEILDYSSYFPKLKLLNVIDYFRLTPEKKAVVIKKMSDDSLYLEKKYLLSHSDHLNHEYLDSLFIERLLKTNTYLLIPDCCSLFCLMVDDNRLFISLIKFISGQVYYKDISIYYLCALIFEKYKNASPPEIENLLELYNGIEDDETKRELINVLKRIQNSSLLSEDDFSKNHCLIDKYNQCYLYKNDKEKDASYDFIERIPILKLSEYEYTVDKLRDLVDDASLKGILPNSTYQLDSIKDEVSIKYKLEVGFKELTELRFSLSEKDILLVLALMENLYKKSKYLCRTFGRIPSLTANNLFVDIVKKEILFKNVGSMLCPFLVISEQKVRNDDVSEIPMMISLLLESLFFQDDSVKINEFHNKPSNSGPELLLSHFIKRMSSKNHSLRYSHSRFHYIINGLKDLTVDANYEIIDFYFQERLKSRLNEKNHESINWLSVCNALNDFYGELAKVYDSINFNDVKFDNKTFLNFILPQNLHYLSSSLLNLCLNIDYLLEEKISRTACVNLLEFLNYFAIFCIELISFFKIGIGAPQKTSHDLFLDEHQESMTLTAGKYTQEYNARDIRSVQILINKDIINQSIFDRSTNFTLKQVSLFYLLKNFASEVKDNSILVKNKNTLKNDDFDTLVFNLLVRVPKIEEEVHNQVHNLIKALETNRDFYLPEEALKLKDEILILCNDINKIRKKMKYKRYCGQIVKIDKLPWDIYCRRYIGKEYQTSEKSLFKIPLSNLFPSSKSKCSWDMDNNEIYNLVIPNERISKLIAKLTKGKIFGYNFKYIYSEKAKLIWDIVLIVILSLLFNSYGVWMKLICGSGIIFFLGKIFIRDIKYWSININRVIEYIRK
jgi:hypothetical protein